MVVGESLHFRSNSRIKSIVNLCAHIQLFSSLAVIHFSNFVGVDLVLYVLGFSYEVL